MKIKTILMYFLALGLLVLSTVSFVRQKNLIAILNNSNKSYMEKIAFTNEVIKKEIEYRIQSFSPKSWDLVNLKNDAISGKDVFLDEPILVLNILPNSCLECVEKEMESLKKVIDHKEISPEQILIVTNFSTYARFKVFNENTEIKEVRMLNRKNIGDREADGAATYFLWDNAEVSNIYIPRLGDQEINKHYLDLIESRLKMQAKMLYIINGKEFYYSKSYINQMNIGDIDEIVTLDSVVGKKKYGEKGKHGVRIITLKN